MKEMNFRVLGSVALLSFSLAAHAVDVYGLSTRNQLVRFDSATPGMISQSSFIWGLAANEELVGIDFRPATGSLYGVGSFGRIYTLDTMSGMATFVTSLTDSVTGAPLSLMGTEFGVDFNPVPDRLRVTSNQGQNLRINVMTGVTVVDGMLNQASGSPFIVASAYTNSRAGATTTTLYNIDSVSDMLTRQIPPNDGTQVNVGMLGMDVSALAGFDIRTTSGIDTAYAALQPAGTGYSRFAQINLMTGMATDIGVIGSNQSTDPLAIRDIAVAPVPEPGTLAALGAGLLTIIRRRKARRS